MNIVSPNRGSRHVPRESLAVLVARVDMCSLVEQYAGPGRANGRTVTFSCPHPAHADRNPSFTVDLRTGRARCWSQCDFSGDALDLVRWLEGLDVAEGARRLRGLLGEWDSPAPLTRPKVSAPAREQRRARISTDEVGAISPETRERTLRGYCRERGWPSSVAETFGLDVVRDTRGAIRVRHNYFGPSSSGEWVPTWYQDRRVPLREEGPSSSGPKWLSTPGAAAYPYNLRSLESEHLEAVVITEGPADCITASVALEGVPGVAVIGVPGANAWRPEWVALVEGLRVIICRDNDEGGARFLDSVSRHFPAGGRVLTPRSKDLTEEAQALGLEEVKALLVAALGGVDPLPRAIELVLTTFPGSYFVEEVGA
jgi:DNA primase